MRTILVALVALLTFGSVSVQAAPGKSNCRGSAQACSATHNKAVKKNTYAQRKATKPRQHASAKKRSYAKKRTSKKRYTSTTRRSAKRSYGKSKKSARRSYSKQNVASRGTLYGKASFYWQPQALASGGRFNPNAMTAAHKTLPFGTRVRVTNKNNGRSVTVLINDRGPYIAGRIIDLSKAAAYKIGMQKSGVVPVSVEVLGRG